jgi:hypothetical protein
MMSWFQKWLEKRHNRFYEGFDVPVRYHTEIEAFASQGPHTRHEWGNFANVLAHRAYAEGYVRGIEWVERDREAWWPEIDPEVLADVMDPAWRQIPIRLEDADHIVPDVLDEVKVLQDGMDKMIRQQMEAPSEHPLIRDARKGPGDAT